MNPDTKRPREWWIDPTESDESEDCDVRQYDAFNKHPGQGPLDWQANLVHVVEKSALDSANAEIERLKARPMTIVNDSETEKFLQSNAALESLKQQIKYNYELREENHHLKQAARPYVSEKLQSANALLKVMAEALETVDRVARSSAFTGVFIMSEIHGAPYNGEIFGPQLESALTAYQEYLKGEK